MSSISITETEENQLCLFADCCYYNSVQKSKSLRVLHKRNAFKNHIVSNRTIRRLIVAGLLILFFNIVCACSEDTGYIVRQVSIHNLRAVQVHSDMAVLRYNYELNQYSMCDLFKIDIVNRSVEDAMQNSSGVVDFMSITEANHYSPFQIVSPSYLYFNDAILEHVWIWYFEDGSLSYDAIIHYSTLSNRPSIVISLEQKYIGLNAHIDIETTFSIENVMISNLEAVFVNMSYPNPVFSGRLIWFKDGVLYELSGYSEVLDIDILISVAESIDYH